ncbi:uncharacterized protein JCM15063_002009 [Sporobolomyces koalae]|uniref:uncharacterized protein n=1 Tax=Sporobolomyces koalae TaxID=500713 RepID=UPI003172D1E0
MSSTIKTSRFRSLYATITTSRLTYVLLIDTALTFILFTFIYHHHLTSILNNSNLISLCRSIRILSRTSTTAIRNSESIQSICSVEQTIHAPTVLQKFLLVTSRHVLEGDQGSLGEGSMIGWILRKERNTRVLLVVLVKVLAWVLLVVTASRGGLARNDQRDNIEHNSIELESNEKNQTHVSVQIVASSPTSDKILVMEEEDRIRAAEEEEEEEAEDLPWILLAVSLILHLSIALFDLGAFNLKIWMTSIPSCDNRIGFGAVTLLGLAVVGGGWRKLRYSRMSKSSIVLGDETDRKMTVVVD